MKHGHTTDRKPSPTYNSWSSMIDRCRNPNSPHYNRYGGRGITVCHRWMMGEGGIHPLLCFIEDMSERPSKMFTIERIDNDGDYTPNNCKWATRKEQAQNRTTARYHLLNGKKYTLEELSEMSGVSKERLRHRICRSCWPVEKAVSIKGKKSGARVDHPHTLW